MSARNWVRGLSWSIWVRFSGCFVWVAGFSLSRRAVAAPSRLAVAARMIIGV